MHLSALQHVEQDYGVGLRRLLLLVTTRDQYILGMDALEQKAIKQKKSRTVSFSTALRDLRDSSTTPMEWIRAQKVLSDNE